MSQKPSVGRIVLYKAPVEGIPGLDHEVLPMIITHVHSDGTVSGVVFSAVARRAGLDTPTEVITSRRFGDDLHQLSWPTRD